LALYGAAFTSALIDMTTVSDSKDFEASSRA
jgi:hypothetical protein